MPNSVAARAGRGDVARQRRRRRPRAPAGRAAGVAAAAASAAGARPSLRLVGRRIGLLGLARHARLVGGGGDVAVGGAAPVAVEGAVEGRGARQRRPRRAARPTRRSGGRGGSERSTLTQPGGVRGERHRSARSRPRPSRGAGAVGGDVAVRVAREQQPARARSRGCPRSPPTRRRLVLGAGQRDVGEPEVLAALLLESAGLVAAEVGALEPDVDRAARSRRRGRGRRPGPALSSDAGGVPQVRAGRRPGTRAPCCGGSSGPGRPRRRTPAGGERSSSPSCSAAAIRWRSQTVSAAVPSCSVDAAACSSWPTWRRSVRRRSPVGEREHAARQPLDERDRLDQRRQPAPRAAPRAQRVQAAVDVLPRRRRRPPRRRSAGPAQERASSSPRVRATRRGGRSIASSSRSHSRAAGVANTLPAPLMTAGTPTALQRVADQRGVAVACARARPCGPGGSARHDRSDAARSTHPRTEAHEVARPDRLAMCSRRGRRARRSPARGRGDRRVGAIDDPHPQRRSDRRAVQTRLPVGAAGPHLPVDDPRMPELGAAEHRVVGVDQPLVAAPVDYERRRCSPAVLAASR